MSDDAIARVFRQHSNALITAMKVTGEATVQLVANELHVRGIISDETKDYVETARGVSSYNMASHMLKNVEAKFSMAGGPHAVDTLKAFCAVVYPYVQDVVKNMEQALLQDGVSVELVPSPARKLQRLSHESQREVIGLMDKWTKKRRGTIELLNELANKMDKSQKVQAEAKPVFVEGWLKMMAGFTQGFTAPDDASEDYKTNALETMKAGLTQGLGAGVSAVVSTRLDIEPAQRAIKEDVQKSSVLRDALECAGLDMNLGEAELSELGNLGHEVSSAQHLRAVIKQLHASRDKILQLLQELNLSSGVCEPENEIDD